MPETRDEAEVEAAVHEGEGKARNGGKDGAGRIPELIELIHRASVSRWTAALLIAFCLGTAAAWIHNAANLNVKKHFVDGDENFVLTQGVRHLTSRVPDWTVKVGEMNRWFARALYPAGLVYMNRHMGGGGDMHRSRGYEAGGLRYPGGTYLKRHFHNLKEMPADPNIQDFVFFMRLAFGTIAVASFCLALWGLYGRFGFASAAAYGSLILSSLLVFEQLQQFYSETTMFIVFNLAAFLYLRYGLHRSDPPSLRIAAWFGIVSAAALSTKPTGIMIAALLACVLIADARRRRHGPIVRIDVGRLFSLRTRKRRPGRPARAGWSRTVRIEVCLLFFLAFMYLINVPLAGSVAEYLHWTAANVYNFAGRSYLGPERWTVFRHLEDDTGALELLVSIPGIGWFIVLLSLGGLLSLALPPRREMAPVYALGAAVVLIVSSFSNQTVYLVRNFASVYVAMSFIVAVAAGDLLERLPLPKRKLAAAFAAPVLTAALLAAGVHLWRQTTPLKEAFFEAVLDDVAQCGNVAAIGLPDGDVQALRERVGAAGAGAGGEVAAFPQVPRFFHRDRITYDEHKKRLFAKYHEYRCLVVYREDYTATKQITNFFAPKYYELRERIGDRFFFVIRP